MDKKDQIISGRLVPITQVGDLEYAVDAKDYNAYLADKGVTQEMRQQIAEANTALQEDLLKFAADKVLAQKDPDAKVTVEVATARGASMTVGVAGRTEHRKPKTDEKVINYGSCSLRLSQTLPLVLRKEGGVVDAIAEKCRAKFLTPTK